MSVLVIIGYIISALSGAVTLADKVVGLDVSIQQDRADRTQLSTLVAPSPAVPPAPAALARAAAPPLPLCPRLTATMDDDALNLIELSRVGGKCRR